MDSARSYPADALNFSVEYQEPVAIDRSNGMKRATEVVNGLFTITF